MNNIIDGKLKTQEDPFFLMKLKGEILQESMNKFKLVYSKKEKHEKYAVLWTIIIIFVLLLKEINFIFADVFIFVFILIPMMYFSILSLSEQAEHNKSKNESFLNVVVRKRTQEGESLNKKIEGLKVFLKDYSMLNEKGAELINVWEDYMIYSVLFGQNQKIVEEYKKYIE